MVAYLGVDVLAPACVRDAWGDDSERSASVEGLSE